MNVEMTINAQRNYFLIDTNLNNKNMTTLELTCTSEDFKIKILQAIEGLPKIFEFRDLKNKIRGMNVFKNDGNDPYTNYSEEIICIINSTIWKQIWDQQLMFDLTKEKFPFSQSETIYLI